MPRFFTVSIYFWSQMKTQLAALLILFAGFGCSHEECRTTLDKQTKELLTELNRSPVDMTRTPLPELRKMFPPPPSPQLSGIAQIKNLTIPNSDVGLRVYTPKKPKESGPLPTFIFIHGGGWALGSLDDYDSLCQEISAQSECLLIAVDYPLAPEHPFPEPADACYLAAQWISDHIVELGGQQGKIAIGGDSAGANLAAAVTLMARDKQSPHFMYQMLICPALNYNFETLSYYEYAQDYFLTKSSMEFFWGLYLPTPEDGQNPIASPLKAKSLASLPPACLVVTDFDPLRDEGLSYATRLSQENVPITLHRLNTIHGFYRFPQLHITIEAVEFIAKQLKEAFAN